MGSGMDEYFAGLMVGAPGAFGAGYLLLRYKAIDHRHRISGALSGALAAIAFLFLALPWLISTGLNGNHVCGPSLNPYRESLADGPLLPAVHCVLSFAIGMIALRSMKTPR